MGNAPFTGITASTHEIPPNGQGLAALVALGMLERLDIRIYAMDSADGMYLQVEAMKGFPRGNPPVHRRPGMHDHRAGGSSIPRVSCAPGAYDPHGPCARARRDITADGGTVYLTTADEKGGMVSLIQSNFTGFGSGVVVPGTGISLQNRARGFTLEKGHPNAVGGGKRPFHTIIPGFVTRDSQPLLSFGVMGGYMQPQGHVQMVVRLFDYGQNPQAACDAPRWHIAEDGRISLEPAPRRTSGRS